MIDHRPTRRVIAGWGLLLSLVLAARTEAAPGHGHGGRKRSRRPLPAQQMEFEGGETRALREAWWLRQRTFPSDRIPLLAYPTATARWNQLVATLPSGTVGSRLAGIADSHGAWSELGPAPMTPAPETKNSGNLSGRFRALAISPANSQILYAGAAQGGIWKSIDAGTSWMSLGDALPSLAIGALAIDPAAPDTIYAGTGERGFGVRGHGVLKSVDGGLTWSRPAGDQFTGATTSRMVIDPDTHVIYLSTTAGSSGAGSGCTNFYFDRSTLGLWRSGDGAVTWTRIAEGGVTDFEIDLDRTPREFFYYVSNSGAFHLVEGGSAEPLDLPSSMTSPPGTDVQLAIAPSNHDILYAGVGIDGGSATLFASRDHGRSWNEIPNSPNYCYTQCNYTNTLTVHPTDPETVYIGGGLCSLWKGSHLLSAPKFRAISMPNGLCSPDNANWYDHYVHPDAHLIVLDPVDAQIVYAATDGGLFRSTDGGNSWSDLNEGVGTVQFYGICVDPLDPAHLFGGAQDNGSLETGDAPMSWHGLITGDGGPCVAAALSAGQGSPHVVLTNDLGSVYVIPPGGNYLQTFATSPTYCKKGDPGCGERSAFIAPLVGDPSDPLTLYIGTHHLWRSGDGASLGSWKSISPDLTAGSNGVLCTNQAHDSDYITAIAVAPTASSTLYTGSAGGRLHRSDDSGGKWTDITAAETLPRRWVSAIAVDAADPHLVFVAFSGFSATTPQRPGHIFGSTDGGASWTLRDITVDVPVDSLIAHPTETGLLHAGTDLGVFTSADGGQNWTPQPGLPNAEVMSLALHAGTNTLYAGTHGRGAWARTFAPSLTVDPATVSVTVTLGGSTPPHADVTLNVSSGVIGAISDFTATPRADGFSLAGDVPGGHSAGLPVPIHFGIDATAVGEFDGAIVVADPRASPPAIEVPVHVSVVAASHGCGCELGGAARVPPLGALFSFAALGVFAVSRSRSRSRSRDRIRF